MAETYRCTSCWVVFTSEGEHECPYCGEDEMLEIVARTPDSDEED